MRLRASIGLVALVSACNATVTDRGAGGQLAADGGAGGETTVTCPGAPPEHATSCDDDTLVCTYGAPECQHQASCEAGAWRVEVTGDCTSEPECPTEIPAGGCTEAGLTCTYLPEPTCKTTTEVTCIDDVWVVTQSSCSFVCPDAVEDLPTPCDPCCHHPCDYVGPAFCDEWFGRCEADGTWSIIRPVC